jgi:DNA-binding transcriptional LysR family regulator
LYCDGPTGIKAAVRQKMGVGVALADSIQSEVASGEFKILKVIGLELVGQSYIVYSKKRPRSAIAQEFLEMLRNERDRIASRGRSNRSSRLSAAFRSNR